MEDNATTNNLRRLSDADLEVAQDEPDVRGWTVIDQAGEEWGDVEDLIVDAAAMKVRYLQIDPDDDHETSNGGALYVPIDRVDLDRKEKRVILRGTAAAIREMIPGDLESRLSSGRETERVVRRTDAARGNDEVERLTRAEEEVRIGKRAVQTGEVLVGKHVETGRVHEEVSVARDEVRVERRPVAEGRTSGEIGASDREIRVPIMEEEVVVEKRPVVKEEIVISKERVEESRPVDVEVRKEEFDIKGGERVRGGER
jgi:uncharacterized protein (TIGR02271 family)